MKRLSMKASFRILSCLISTAMLCAYLVPAHGAETPEKAPENPAFSEFMQHRFLLRTFAAQSNRLGYVPSPADRSNLKAGAAPTVILRGSGSPPSSYDLRTLGRVTPVRDQGSCGSCWAFGAMASLESSLLTAETWDFSENNLINTHGFDPGPCDGGGADMSAAYLMRWGGPINDADDPYYDGSTPSPTGLTVQKHEQNVIFLPNRTSDTDNDAIKNAIINYGAVTAGMYWADGSYNSANHTYYYSGSATYGNHEIAIVGWDDNFAGSNFTPAAPGNGAFILKNSWGTSFGDSGYFYMSYYDNVLGYDEMAVFTTPERNTNYSRIYSYDPLGYVGGWGFRTNTGWFANIFTAQGNDRIAAVSFYNAALNSPYEVYVYTDLTNTSNPRSGTLAATTTGTLANSGYLTVPLTTPVSVASGHLFSVVVKLTTPGFIYPIPSEWAYPGYSSAATASAGQSFISSNGTSWSDAVYSDSTLNVCLKAYAATAMGITKLLWRNPSSGQNVIWSMDGISWTGAYSTLPNVPGPNWDIAGVGDFRSTGNYDILWRNSATGVNTIWFMNGTTWTGASANFTSVSDPNWKIRGVADFTGDGKPDVLWRNTSTGVNTIWFMNGTSWAYNYSYVTNVPGPDWDIAGVGDFNSDGKPDILWRNSATGQNVVWYMNGTAWNGSSSGALPAQAIPWGIAGVGDFNNDNHVDILWRNPTTGNNMVWYLNGVTQIGTGNLTNAPSPWSVKAVY